MPPRSRKPAAKAAAASPALPLDGCKIALSGTFPRLSHATLKGYLESLGAAAVDSVSPDVSHLIVSNGVKPQQLPAKVKTAQDLGILVVDVQWLLDCHSSKARQPETSYLALQPPSAGAATPVPAPPAPAPAPAPAAIVVPVPAPSSAATANGTNGASGTKRAAAPDGTASKSSRAKRVKAADVPAKSTKIAKITVPVDEFCHLAGAAVHVDDDGVAWDASLNQTNSGNNNNKFYIIQVLRKANGSFQTWTRWGRVGERGQSAIASDGNLEGCQKAFKKKFKDKSGLAWEDRSNEPLPSKYAYIERSYEPDSDSDDGGGVGGSDSGASAGADAADAADAADGAVVVKQEPPKCTLAPPVQSLMELIFNKGYFAATMQDLNYDANKLPLGKLSKATISRGFQALKDLSALLDSGTARGNAVERLSNLYYSVIPHAFGRNRPPIIQTYQHLKKEVELLESLSDMKDAELLMKVDRANSGTHSADAVHSADKLYRGLGMREMTPLARDSTEFTELASYLNKTRGATHRVKYAIEEIFRIERDGEKDRFSACRLSGLDDDTRLLWHGSRATNFGGILGQGLRIAPPEAPSSGYMFGKGIYLADMSSKSAGYCCANLSGNTALLLLCEAKLGSPLQKLTAAAYDAGETAKEKGLYATLGQGETGPVSWKDARCVNDDLAGVKMPDVSTSPQATNTPGATLLYNEYIVYDVSQVRLRYLFRVRM